MVVASLENNMSHLFFGRFLNLLLRWAIRSEVSFDVQGIFMLANYWCGICGGVCENSAAIHQEIVACLISDPMYSFGGSVAQSFNLRRMMLRTGGMSAIVLYDSLPMLRQKGYCPLQGAEDYMLLKGVVEKVLLQKLQK